MPIYHQSKFVGRNDSRKDIVERIITLMTKDGETQISVMGVWGIGKTWIIRHALEEASKKAPTTLKVAAQLGDTGHVYHTKVEESICKALEVEAPTMTQRRRKIWQRLQGYASDSERRKVAIWLPLCSNETSDEDSNPHAYIFSKQGLKEKDLHLDLKWLIEHRASLFHIEPDQRFQVEGFHDTREIIDLFEKHDKTISCADFELASGIRSYLGGHPGLLQFCASLCPPTTSLENAIRAIQTHPDSASKYQELRQALPEDVRTKMEDVLEKRLDLYARILTPGDDFKLSATGLIDSNGVELRPTALLREFYESWRKEQKKMQVLTIGINEYSSPFHRLNYAVNDAVGFQGIFTGSGAEVVQLLDYRATKDAIINALKQLAECSRPQDTVVVFFAGHGMHNESGNYLCPFNANPDDPQRTLISKDELSTALQGINVPNLVVLLDACHAGGAAEIRSARGTDFKFGIQDEIVQQLLGPSDSSSRGRSEPPDPAPRNRAIIAACGVGAGEVSYESPELRHGYFTYYLIEGLKGQAANNGGPISVLGLATYVSTEVPKATRHLGSQNPFYHMHGQKFDIATPNQESGGTNGMSQIRIEIHLPREHISHGEQLKKLSVAVDPPNVRYQYRWRIARGNLSSYGWSDADEVDYTAPRHGGMDEITVEVRLNGNTLGSKTVLIPLVD